VWLLAQTARLERVCGALAEQGRLGFDAPALLVIPWAWKRLGGDAGRILALLEPSARVLIAREGEVPEPTRSAVLYWAHRAGLCERWPDGPPPDGARALAYHHTHAIFHATLFGEDPVARGTVVTALDALDRAMADPALGDDADLVGEALLCEAAVCPVDVERVRGLAGRLTALATPDGSLGAGALAFDLRHHATCVAVLALHRAAAALDAPSVTA
jgi:hypothetical protein